MGVAQHGRRATHHPAFAEEHTFGILSSAPIQMHLFIAFDYTVF